MQIGGIKIILATRNCYYWVESAASHEYSSEADSAFAIYIWYMVRKNHI